MPLITLISDDFFNEGCRQLGPVKSDESRLRMIEDAKREFHQPGFALATRTVVGRVAAHIEEHTLVLFSAGPVPFNKATCTDIERLSALPSMLFGVWVGTLREFFEHWGEIQDPPTLGEMEEFRQSSFIFGDDA